MKVAAAHLSDTGRNGAWRICATWMLLLAFTLQSYITQTHVHREPGGTHGAAIVRIVGQPAPHAVSPTGDATIACPICQAIVVAGAFFVPTTPILSRPATLAETAAFRPIVAGLAVTAASFSWRSRAPPQH